MHAGELEAPILLAARPAYVGPHWPPAWQQDDHTTHDRRDLPTLGIEAYTSSGVIGQPSTASDKAP